MNLEDHLRAVIVEELRRQSELSERPLRVAPEQPGRVEIQGHVDVDELVMVITGALAGGP